MNLFIENIAGYVNAFLEAHLPAGLSFHNVQHTHEVVEAVQQIGKKESITNDEMLVAVTAAWFHDTGYTKLYAGHETASRQVAKAYLEKQDCTATFINAVDECIAATIYPQQPTSKAAGVLCDADLYHFSKPDYFKYENALRKEFVLFLGKEYSDEDWLKNNCDMLRGHHYFTSYGQTVLQKFKMLNIQLLKCNEPM